MVAKRWFVLWVAGALLAGACGGSSDGDGADGGDGGDGNGASACGLDALAAADQPVEITFWHTMARENKEWLEATTADFNESQDEVRVKLVEGEVKGKIDLTEFMVKPEFPPDDEE